MQMFKRLIRSLTTIGDTPEDSVESRQQHHFLIYMALFMSGGGVLWGSLCLYFDLWEPAIIPFGYVILTALNLTYFKFSKHFSAVRSAQVTFSLILPVMFQLMLGGFVSSGAVMLWSLLALGASLTFSDMKLSFLWLGLYVIFTMICGYLDELVRLSPVLAPDAGRTVLFFVINISTISSIFFVFTLLMLKNHRDIQSNLHQANTKITELVGSLEHRVEERTRELREALGYNGAVFQSLDDGLLVVDLNLEVIAANPKLMETLSCLGVSASGSGESDVARPESTLSSDLPQEIWTLIQSSIDGLQVLSIELDSPTQTSAQTSPQISVRATASPVFLSRDDESQPELVGCVVLARDITADKRIVEIEAKLAVSERMSALGTLAAGIAHEINNPLTYVMSNLEMIHEDLQSSREVPDELDLPDLIELASEGLDGVQRISKIVQELRSFMRSREVKREAVDLVEVVRSAMNLAQHEVRHSALIETRFAHRIPLAYIDERQVVQVVVNMLINAAQAFNQPDLDRNRVWVDVYPRWEHQDKERDDNREMLAISIRDNASGMSPEVMRKVFDPFFTTKTAVGTGLGLAICHRMIQDLDGSISLKSKEGVGTVFEILVPQYDEAVTPHIPLDKTPTPNDATSRAALEEIKGVFVIDDEPVVCSTVQRSLGAVRTRAFTRAQEALDVISSLDRDALPDVIICDMMMPEMNGIELYEELERLGLAQRVFFITGGSTHDEVSSFLAAHPSRVLYKPFSAEALRAQVLKTRRRAIVC